MPLTLTLAEGEDFYIRNDRWEVAEVFLVEGFKLRAPNGKIVDVTSTRAEEIDPGVMVSDGHRVLVGKARLVFNADRSIPILRGELFREKNREDDIVDDYRKMGGI